MVGYYCTQSRAACQNPLAMKPGLPSVQIHIWKTTNKKISSSFHSALFFFSLHRTCRTAFVLLCHCPVIRSKYKIKNFQHPTHNQAKNSRYLCNSTQGHLLQFLSLPRDKNCDQMEKCLHLREAIPKSKGNLFSVTALPLCFD